jgi:hypothetical protein
MVYTSNNIETYTAVFAHIDKVKRSYEQYGISFAFTILTDGEVYKVRAVAKDSVLI